MNRGVILKGHNELCMALFGVAGTGCPGSCFDNEVFDDHRAMDHHIYTGINPLLEA